MRDKLEIQELIDQSSDRQLEILLKLKSLNRKAYLHMKGFGKNWKQKYYSMWRKIFWKDAKVLLKEYFNLENGGICSTCSRPLGDSFTLHHKDFYNSLNYFTPLFVTLIHRGCHAREHLSR